MMMLRWLVPWLLVAGCVLSACTAPGTPKARMLERQSSSYIVTDARQRVVLNASLGNFSRPGLADPNEIVCSEPSPDVATAVATSFAGTLSAFGRGSASLSAGQVENLAQLVERTATIQLLRDKMYQSCLAYANGAIGGTTYSLIMSELDRTIVTLLLGENAAAAFGRAGAALGSEASSSASGDVSGPAADVKLDEAVTAVEEAEVALAAAEKKLADVHKEKGEACGLEKASESGPGDACGAISAEQAQVDAAEQRRDATLQVLKTSASTRTAALARATRTSGIGGLTRSPTPQLARELRLLQDNFLAEDSVEFFLPTCLVELGLHNEAGSIAGRAMDLLSANYVNARSAQGLAEDDLRSLERRSDAKSAEIETARSSVEDAARNTRKAENSLMAFIQNPQALLGQIGQESEVDPNAQVFSLVMARWQSGVTKDDERMGKEAASINDLAAAANLNRRSMLAAQCIELLPEHLYWSRRSALSYRTKRLEVLRQIELFDQGRQAIADRTSLLDAFRQSMAACKEGDANQRSDCESAVRDIVTGIGKTVDAGEQTRDTDVDE